MFNPMVMGTLISILIKMKIGVIGVFKFIATSLLGAEHSKLACERCINLIKLKGIHPHRKCKIIVYNVYLVQKNPPASPYFQFSKLLFTQIAFIWNFFQASLQFIQRMQEGLDYLLHQKTNPSLNVLWEKYWVTI